MSSSTSISKAGSRRDIRIALVALAIFSGILAAAAAVNYRADPYGFFHASGSAPEKNLVLHAMIQTAKMSPEEKGAADVVVVGDSRAFQLSPNRRVRLFTSEGHTILNLGVGGASFEEMTALLSDEKKHLTGMRVLIFTLPFERLAERPRADRSVEARPIARSRLRYLLNWNLLGQSMDTLHRRRAQQQNQPGAAEAPPNIPSAAQAEAVYAEWNRMFRDYDPERAEARLAVTREIVQSLTALGVQVVFWQPPVHERIRKSLADSGHEPDRDRCNRALALLGPVADMTGDIEVAGEPLSFIDPVHTSNSAAILRKLIAQAGR